MIWTKAVGYCSPPQRINQPGDGDLDGEKAYYPHYAGSDLLSITGAMAKYSTLYFISTRIDAFWIFYQNKATTSVRHFWLNNRKCGL